MKEKIYPVYIEFKDHASQSAWLNKNELTEFKPELVRQLGWLVDEDDTCYKVAGQVCNNGDVGDIMVILKSTIICLKKLKFRIPKSV
jgi:hypothetical protein